MQSDSAIVDIEVFLLGQSWATINSYRPGYREAEYSDDRVCLSVCVCLSASISPEIHVQFLPIFCACYQWPWLGPHPAASRYVMYFRFYGSRQTFA